MTHRQFGASFLEIAGRVLDIEAAALRSARSRLGQEFVDAADLMQPHTCKMQRPKS